MQILRFEIFWFPQGVNFAMTKVYINCWRIWWTPESLSELFFSFALIFIWIYPFINILILVQIKLHSSILNLECQIFSLTANFGASGYRIMNMTTQICVSFCNLLWLLFDIVPLLQIRLLVLILAICQKWPHYATLISLNCSVTDLVSCICALVIHRFCSEVCLLIVAFLLFFASLAFGTLFQEMYYVPSCSSSLVRSHLDHFLYHIQ